MNKGLKSRSLQNENFVESRSSMDTNELGLSKEHGQSSEKNKNREIFDTPKIKIFSENKIKISQNRKY